MKNFIQEFKEFAIKGNVVDMAVGVIIGGAFGRIVSSLVGDVVMPILGLIVGGVNFTAFEYVLRTAEGGTASLVLKYGNFFQTVFDFTIMAFSIFLAIKFINRLRRQEAKSPTVTEPPKPTNEELLLAEIRDLLKAK